MDSCMVLGSHVCRDSFRQELLSCLNDSDNKVELVKRQAEIMLLETHICWYRNNTKNWDILIDDLQKDRQMLLRLYETTIREHKEGKYK